MLIDNLIPYILLCLVLVISPGPNTFLIFSTASSAGKNDALLKILGLVIATYCHGFLSLFGISLIVLKSPILFNTIKILGALYLFYLGAKFIWQAWFFSKKAPTIAKVKKLSVIKNFSAGFITQILNPKVSTFYIAAFPQFINFNSPHYYLSGTILISIHVLTIAIWFTVMTFFVHKFTLNKGSGNLSRVTIAISGILLVYFAILLGLQPLPSIQS
ncbi:LysE family translocator [Pelistega sp. NLN82]|uniref:LysE family translocator n=1 Tax=Pelistega ratti TaxID=2652177 RepID=A0A6L9Y7L4_9BURK|nr:LysE family translocator [Pelistega ratti]NEN76366.1 LysE family translocator [Pelistega ratti]